MVKTFTPEQVARYRKRGDVTPNGVAFTDVLAGPKGCTFTLIREPHHDDDDLRLAGHQLRNLRDVVGPIQLATVKS